MAYNGYYNGYDDDSYSDYTTYGDESSDQSSDQGDDSLVQCPHCPNTVKKSNYRSHIARVHTCEECGNQMPKESLKGHKERKHMETCETCGAQMLKTPMKQHLMSHYVKCKHCQSNVHQDDLQTHIQDNHPLHSTLGMICLDKITDSEFNTLVAANRIFSKDGHLFKRI